MKITFISTLDNTWGGSEVLWQQTAKKMLLEGHEISIAVYETMMLSDKIIELRSLGAKIIPIKSWTKIRNSNIFKRLFYSLKQRISPTFNIIQILKLNSDVFFINQPATYEGFFYPDFALLYKQLKNRYLLLTHGDIEHRILSPSQIAAAREIFLGAIQTLFVSQRSINNCQHQLASSLKNSTLVDNPLNLPDARSLPYPPLEPTINFASVARLDASCKGQDLLIAALANEQWRHRNWVLNLYGTGPDEHYLQQLVQYYQLENRVIFHGHVKDIRKVWETNHILIMPSFAEGKPISLAEAMISGRPAIVSDVAGNTELVLDGENGYVIPAATKPLIEDGLERAWNTKNNWESMGKKAHEYVSKVYDLNPVDTLAELILKNH
jgi:glycosyltransferase involved in cell wall biosynthesis